MHMSAWANECGLGREARCRGPPQGPHLRGDAAGAQHRNLRAHGSRLMLQAWAKARGGSTTRDSETLK